MSSRPVVLSALLSCGCGPAEPPEAVEAALDLDRAARRLIQQGLRAEGFDPGAADGLFGARTRAAIRRWQESRAAAATGFLDGSEADVLRAAPCCALGGGRRGTDVGVVRNGDPGGCSACSRRRGGGDRGGSTGRGGRGGAPESRPVDDGGGFRPATTAEVDGALWQRERFRLRRSGWTVPR